MRILFSAGRELGYTRNDVLLRAFRRFAQVEVVGVEGRPASLLANSLRLSLRLVPRLLRGGYDLAFIGFYGHLLMIPAGLFSRRPVLFDAFVSTFDTLGSDRKVISENSLAGRAAFTLDRFACARAGRVLLDTGLHADYFTSTFGIARSKFCALPVGCNEDLFYPRAAQKRIRDREETLVLYYSSYLPLHGVETVVRAAAALRGERVRFRLIGGGQEYPRIRKLADDLHLSNVEFGPFIPLAQLPEELAAADIGLGGHFGESAKAGRVVPGKVYQVLAMGRPLVAASTPANNLLLRDEESACLCPPADPPALAEAILKLHGDPNLRAKLAAGGRRLYEAECSEALITSRLKSIVDELLTGEGGGG